MNITEIKEKLGYSDLNLNTATDGDGKPTDWMRHWDNENRVAVSIHKETVKEIQADNATTLGIQEEVRKGKLGDYQAVRIVRYTEPEVVL